jgi:aspartate beta-hydroxylase
VTWTSEHDKAAACAKLAVAQGIWSHTAQRPRDLIAGLAAKPLHDPGEFWFTGLIEERFPEIRAEILAADGDGCLFSDGRWCASLPVTQAVLERIPEVTTFNPGTIVLSRLRPGTQVKPHCGATNAILRLYLPISGIEGAWMRVAHEVVAWWEGRCVVLDDSFECEAEHRGTEDFVALVLDMPHPELDPAHRARLVGNRLTAQERIAAFMRDRGIAEVSYQDGEVTLHPGAEMRQLIFQYMRAAGVAGVEVGGDQIRWLQTRGSV